MMKKIMGALTSAIVALVSLSPPASAQSAAAPNCQFGNTYSTLVTWEYLKTRTDVAIGTIQLCRDSEYKYWGFVLLNNPLTASQWADAVLTRYREGLQSSISCDSPGGNGIVLPGQTRCWTPKFTGLSRLYTFRAEGTVTSSHTGDWYAWGGTNQTR